MNKDSQYKPAKEEFHTDWFERLDSPFRTPYRECDDPYSNFLRIRDNRLWEKLYSSRQAKKELALAC